RNHVGRRHPQSRHGFRADAASRGHWAETVLHSFEAGEGALPVAGLAFDPAGNLYGATKSGGSNGVGTIFEMMRQSDGWTLNVLGNYGSNGSLVLDKAGNLYGAFGHGSHDGGAITE